MDSFLVAIFQMTDFIALEDYSVWFYNFLALQFWVCSKVRKMLRCWSRYICFHCLQNPRHFCIIKLVCVVVCSLWKIVVWFGHFSCNKIDCVLFVYSMISNQWTVFISNCEKLWQRVLCFVPFCQSVSRQCHIFFHSSHFISYFSLLFNKCDWSVYTF